MPVALAFLGGILVNTLAQPGAINVNDSVVELFNVDQRGAAAWITWIAATVVLATIALRAWARLVESRTNEAVRISALFTRYIERDLRQFHRGRIAWGWQVVLQNAPKLDGWRPQEISITHEPSQFRFESEQLREAYARWLDTPSSLRVREGTSFRLMENPAAFSDAPTLHLTVQENAYAEAVFFTDIIALTGQRWRYVERTLRNEMTYAHSFCLHATVATRDGAILLTKRSDKVFYHPGAWSCSIEERLSADDLAANGTGVVAHWIHRALREELGLTQADVTGCDPRILAVFLEADILNCSLAALVTLKQSQVELDAILTARPRADYEFSDWKFVKWSEIPAMLVGDDTSYHPSSGLRMFLAGVAKEGPYRFAQSLLRAEDQREEHERH